MLVVMKMTREEKQNLVSSFLKHNLNRFKVLVTLIICLKEEKRKKMIIVTMMMIVMVLKNKMK